MMTTTSKSSDYIENSLFINDEEAESFFTRYEQHADYPVSVNGPQYTMTKASDQNLEPVCSIAFNDGKLEITGKFSGIEVVINGNSTTITANVDQGDPQDPKKLEQ